MRHLNDMMVIDCGAIGPDYQPGHAHCDTLSYELAIDGRRVIVDSGVHDYEPTQHRAYARSTPAHNTVVIDGQEQSEMWGVFRVARRARPLPAYVRQETDGRLFLRERMLAIEDCQIGSFTGDRSPPMAGRMGNHRPC